MASSIADHLSVRCGNSPPHRVPLIGTLVMINTPPGLSHHRGLSIQSLRKAPSIGRPILRKSFRSRNPSQQLGRGTFESSVQGGLHSHHEWVARQRLGARDRPGHLCIEPGHPCPVLRPRQKALWRSRPCEAWKEDGPWEARSPRSPPVSAARRGFENARAPNSARFRSPRVALREGSDLGGWEGDGRKGRRSPLQGRCP